VRFLEHVASAQSLTDPVRIQAIGASQVASGAPLECAAAPLRPVLNFSFRLQSGYTFRVPLHQFTGDGHTLTVLVRITPEEPSQPPVFLTDSWRLPEAPPERQAVGSGGGFLSAKDITE